MTAPEAKPLDHPRVERRNPYWRSVGSEWRARLVALALGIALGLLVLNYYYQKRIVPEELALGRGATATIATWNGTRVNAWRLEDYEAVFPASNSPAPRTHTGEVVWLGNSQLHAVNQYKEGDTTAPHFASAALNRNVYCLTLPNASLQEHLVVANWVFQRRTPEWLLVPVVFDDTREDGLRPDFKPFDSPQLRATLAASEPGSHLLKELDKLSAQKTDAQGTTREDAGSGLAISLQIVVEDALQKWADSHWDLWAKRGEILSTVIATELYQLRNKIFGITAKSKRPRIELRYQKNMAALKALLAAANAAGVKTIVYIPPLRWDVDPPYFLDQYEACKADARAAALEAGAYFVDLDKTVPTEFWGDRFGDIDFMHFQLGGHKILGEEIARTIRRAESGELKPLGNSGGGSN